MKILYVASNPIEQTSLDLEREMTELQRRLMAVDELGSINFRAMPHLQLDDFIQVISEFCPDIVHISAHGTKKGLLIADGKNGEKIVSNEQFLGRFRALRHRPTLVYLNACEGDDLAEMLAELVPFVIGITDRVTNEAAIRAAIAFYEWLATGKTIQEAHDVSAPLLEFVDEGTVKSRLIYGTEQDPKRKLHDVFRMVACFFKLEKSRKKPVVIEKLEDLMDREGNFEVECGFVGCPENTKQIVMFTTDKSFIDERRIEAGEETIESQLTWLNRSSEDGGEIWFDEETIITPGDSRFYGVAVAAGNTCITVSAMLTEAIKRYYFEERYHELSDTELTAVKAALVRLNENAGPRRNLAANAKSLQKTDELRSNGARAGSKVNPGKRSTQRRAARRAPKPA